MSSHREYTPDDEAPIAAPADQRPPRPARTRALALPPVLRVISVVFAVGALLSLVAGAVVGVWVLRLGQDLPAYQSLAQYEPPVTTRVYATDGALVAEFARERRIFMPIDAIPESVKQAFISAEDKTFYEHSGLDLRGVARAAWSNVGNLMAGRRLEGASTITQQVAKNFLLSSEQRIERKVREWLITRRIENAYTKDQILELYLNEIYLGNRSYGVAAAALNYFDKALDELTIEETAYLAAIPKGPSNYHPVNHYERALERRNWVIGRMLDDGKITRLQADAARATALVAKIAPPLGARDWASEYFAEEVRKQIAARYGTDALYDGGLSVRTTVDPVMQKTAGDVLRRWLVEYDRRHGWRGPLGVVELSPSIGAEFAAVARALNDARRISDDMAPWRAGYVVRVDDAAATVGFGEGLPEGRIPLAELTWARRFETVDRVGPEIRSARDVLNPGDVVYVEPLAEPGDYALRQVPAVNGAFIAMDPHTGRVLAMVGGFSFQMSEFNRAVQASRQPGSTFKPFVYAAALDSGYNPSSIVLDAPFVAPSLDSWWKPGNYTEGRFYGESTLRLGIEQSRNTMTARLAQDVGIGVIVDYAQRFGLGERMPRELAISLGAAETTLLRMTSAYSTFVNGGKRITPFLIDRVQDRHGQTIFRQDQRACPGCFEDEWTGQAEPQLADPREQVIDPRTAYQMVSMLEGAVQRGTGSAVRRAVNKPIAGKTGTTNDYKDAWFVGFSPDLAAGAFVGFDQPQPLGNGEAGGKVAAPIFGEFMAIALKDAPSLPFRVPSGIRLVRVNAKTGIPANPGDPNVILEAFKAEDRIGAGATSDDDLMLDPLSATPTNTPEPSVDDLNGLY